MKLALGLSVCIACATCLASQEQIFVPHKVSIFADTGKEFGEVSATVETTKETDSRKRRIKAIGLTVGGKTYAVPEKEFSDLQWVLIDSVELRTVEAGLTVDDPELYLTFQLQRAGAASPEERPTVSIRYRNGKPLERSIREPSQK